MRLHLVLVFLFIFLVGCAEKPICGNGIVEEGESMQTCCEDVGCLGQQRCINHVCVDPTCGECAYLVNHVCKRYSCCSDEDCDDRNSWTKDVCLNPGTREARCDNFKVSCFSDVDCNNGDPSTRDICINPGTGSSRCVHNTIYVQSSVQKKKIAPEYLAEQIEQEIPESPSGCLIGSGVLKKGECDMNNIPYYCNEEGEYVENCLVCSCPSCYTCTQEGTCEKIPGCAPMIECGSEFCNKYQECVRGKCKLKSQNLRFGLVYVYYNQDTYNPDWKRELLNVKSKFTEGIYEITDHKVSATLDILGEVKTSIFCWNPSELGLQWNLPGIDEEIKYAPLPGSSFSVTSFHINPEMNIVQSSCTNCRYSTDEFGNKIYEISCPSPLSYNNLFQTDKLSQLREQIAQQLSFNFDDYDGVFIVFGKLGGPGGASTNDPHFFDYKCKTVAGVLEAYGNLIVSEENLIVDNNYFVDCTSYGNYDPIYGHYLSPGWITLVHEILHGFGAVDVYGTGFAYGIESHRDQAIAIDPRTDESIMGNRNKPSCMEEGGTETDGNVCTDQVIEQLYLDKYNAQLIGID